LVTPEVIFTCPPLRAYSIGDNELQVPSTVSNLAAVSR
jgi:hypothetical protein